MSFNPTMLGIARKLKKLSQKEVSELIGTTQGSISKFELGIQTPNEAIVSSLSSALRVSRDFFYSEDEVYMPAMRFRRARASLPASTRDYIDAKNNVIAIMISRMLKSMEIEFNSIIYSIADINIDHIEKAKKLRELLKVPAGPVKNLMKTVESSGVIVVAHDFESSKFDGVFYPFDIPNPIIFINNSFPGDRMRFTLCHEFMHLILHKDIVDNELAEEQANNAASEFLMPEEEIKPMLYNLNLEKLAHLKRYWKVSMNSLLYRAKSLECITGKNYLYLQKRMSQLGYRTREPQEFDIQREIPTTLTRLFDAHKNQLGYNDLDLEKLFHLPSDDIKSFLSCAGNDSNIIKFTTKPRF